MFSVTEEDLLNSKLNEITNAINRLRDLIVTNMEDTQAIRTILDQCPICDINEGVWKYCRMIVTFMYNYYRRASILYYFLYYVMFSCCMLIYVENSNI